MPYFIAADHAFALTSWLMKPFSQRQMDNTQRIFNYRLSRARRIVENAIGILVHRFRCLLATIQHQPDAAASIVLTCVCLHNLIRKRSPKQHRRDADEEDSNHNVIPGVWRNVTPLLDGQSNLANSTTTTAAKKQRVSLCLLQLRSRISTLAEWYDLKVTCELYECGILIASSVHVCVFTFDICLCMTICSVIVYYEIIVPCSNITK